MVLLFVGCAGPNWRWDEGDRAGEHYMRAGLVQGPSMLIADCGRGKTLSSIAFRVLHEPVGQIRLDGGPPIEVDIWHGGGPEKFYWSMTVDRARLDQLLAADTLQLFDAGGGGSGITFHLSGMSAMVDRMVALGCVLPD